MSIISQISTIINIHLSNARKDILREVNTAIQEHIRLKVNSELEIRRSFTKSAVPLIIPVNPKEGEIYSVVKPFWTYGMILYNVGDELELYAKTNVAPHGHKSLNGNWVVKGKDGQLTVWSSIDSLIALGWIKLKS